MAYLTWLGVLILLFLYSCESNGKLKNIVGDDRFARGNNSHEIIGLFANSKKVESAEKDKGSDRTQAKNGHKKQIVDAIHLGPYHHGHSWGTTSVWPGFAAWGHSWGYPGHHVGWTGYPSYKSQVPGKNPSPSFLHNSQSVKRWWPGYMGGWGNSNPLGWSNPLLRSGISGVSESPSKRWWPGYMGGWGGYSGWGLGGWWNGNWWGHGLGHPHRSQVASSTPKRQYVDTPFDGFHDYFGAGFNFPWGPLMHEYGPFSNFGEWDNPEFGFGPMPLPEFDQDAYYKSKIPKLNERKHKESGAARQFVGGFHPGSCGWGGVIYPGFGLGGTFPLLGVHTGYPVEGPIYRSVVPKSAEETGERHQVINYHPGCYGWGGCLYPGCGYMGGFSWPCHHGCCRSCCCRSKLSRNQGPRYEKGRSRQEIANPEVIEDEEKKMFHSSMERSTSDLTKMAMGFPGMENFRSPFGSNIDPLSGSVASQLGISNQLPTPAMNEPNELMPQSDGLSGFLQSYMSSTSEHSDGAAKPIEDLMTNFNLSPEGDTGMPLTEDGGDITDQTSRRGIIPETKETEIRKKQAVAYPYASTMLPYYGAHGGNAYAAVVPHVGGIPVSFLPGAQLVGRVTDPLHPSHSIHVGAPNVNVDVQTTRAHVAHRPDKIKQRSHTLKTLLGKAVKKVKK